MIGWIKTWLVRREVNKFLSGDGKMQNLLTRLVKFMDGKKTISGAILFGLPAVAAAVASTLSQAGLDPVLVAKYTAWGGGSVLAFIGVIHKGIKFLDDLTPDDHKAVVETESTPPVGFNAFFAEVRRLQAEEGLPFENAFRKARARFGL